MSAVYLSEPLLTDWAEGYLLLGLADAKDSCAYGRLSGQQCGSTATSRQVRLGYEIHLTFPRDRRQLPKRLILNPGLRPAATLSLH